MGPEAIMLGLNAVVSILKSNKDMNSKKNDLGKILKENKDTLNIMMAKGSMVKFLKDYVIEPTAIISNDLKDEEILERLLTLESDIFASFYMQIFDIINKVNGLDGSITIGLLSTNNGNFTKGIKGTLSLLSYEPDYIKDLSIEEYKDSLLPSLSLEESIHARITNTKSNKEPEKKEKPTIKEKDRHASKSKNDDITSGIPSAIVRKFNLEMRVAIEGSEPYFIEVPIIIKLNTVFVKPSSIVNVLSSKENTGFFDRLDEYRSGAISLVDLLTAGDLIQKYKKDALNNQNDALYKLLINKKDAINEAVVKKGSIPFERYYNMLLVTEEDAILIEKAIRGKLSKDKYKEKVLDTMMCLMLTIVDRDYERVNIYIKDIAGVSDLSFKALKKKKDSSDDVGEIYKALLTGRPPVI